MEQINKAICEGLGINAGDAELYNKLQEAEVQRDGFKNAFEELSSKYSDIQAKCEWLEKQPVSPQDSDEAVRLKAMIDVYKEQNQMLLEKLIG